MLFRRVAVAAVLLAVAPIQSLAQPVDFDFRFRYGICSMDELNTFTGWFTREFVDDGGAVRTVMAQVSLNGGQMRHLYETSQKIRFFEYPSRYQSSTPFPGLPSAIRRIHYLMEVRTDGRMHSVEWQDDAMSEPGADGLRRLFGWAATFINGAAAVKALPRPSLPCDLD